MFSRLTPPQLSPVGIQKWITAGNPRFLSSHTGQVQEGEKYDLQFDRVRLSPASHYRKLTAANYDGG